MFASYYQLMIYFPSSVVIVSAKALKICIRFINYGCMEDLYMVVLQNNEQIENFCVDVCVFLLIPVSSPPLPCLSNHPVLDFFFFVSVPTFLLMSL